MRLMPMRATRLDTPPENLDAFIAEIAEGVLAVYGEAAARAYEERAERGFGAAIATPAACLWSVGEGRTSRGLLLGILREGIAEITLVHVLCGQGGAEVEHALVSAATREFRKAGARAILSEGLAYAPMDLDGAFAREGFEAIPRGLLTARAEEVLMRAGACASGEPLGVPEYRAAAECIAAAYVGHPGRRLHPEVCDSEAAFGYVLRVLAGMYGPVLPTYVRGVQRAGRCAGVLLGSEIAPGMGFVLQVATRPEHRGKGLATGLLGGFAGACLEAGVPTLGLGVTLDNPARRLYETLGFRQIRPVTAYTWWREGAAP